MSINFPLVPNVPGVPALQSFPGVAQIAGSIAGNVLTVTSGIGNIAQGLSLSGLGLSPGTILTSGLTSIFGSTGIATLNIAQSIPNIAMDLLGSISGLIDDPTSILEGDTVDAVVGAGAGVRWGIFLDGELVLEPDSFASLEYKKDWHIADYPIEQGNFETYNKVRLPYEARVMITKGGTEADRNVFLERVADVADSLDLYDIVTPDFTYTNANITHYDFQRTAEKGVSLLSVTLWFQEVRLEASSEFTQTASPDSANQVNVGAVQAQPATADVEQAFAGHGATGAW